MPSVIEPSTLSISDLSTLLINPDSETFSPSTCEYNFIVSVSHEKEFAIGIVIAEKI